ncbi:hypothetical protein [Streptomyces sp. NPDC003032]
MFLAHQAAPGTVESAVQALAAKLAGALRHDGGEFSLRECVDALDEPVNAVGAVRGLGADALAPFVLTGCTLTADDAGLVRAAVAAFPAPAAGAEDGGLWVARDAALVTVLAGLGVDAAGWAGLAAGDAVPGWPAKHWAAWSAALARLAPLALPPVEGPARQEALHRRLDLRRGLTRALLRRDHLVAARLARWLALDAHGTEEPLLTPALDHLAVLAADRHRVLFEIAVARRLREGER